MTNTITLPRALVEQALATLRMYEPSVVKFGLTFKHGQDAIAAISAALEQPQVAQEPVAWRLFDGDPFPGTATRHVYYDKDDFKEGVNPTEHFQLEPLYTHPQNLRCKSTQARLATLWGYEKPQPPRQPLTDEQIGEIEGWFSNEFGLEAKHSIDFARAIERAHGIGGEA